MLDLGRNKCRPAAADCAQHGDPIEQLAADIAGARQSWGGGFLDQLGDAPVLEVIVHAPRPFRIGSSGAFTGRDSRSADLEREAAAADHSDALHDPAWREALKRDPKSAIARLPLSDDERSALLNGDVAWLYEQGAHPFLLAYLTRWELFGLTVSLYSERIRAARQSRE